MRTRITTATLLAGAILCAPLVGFAQIPTVVATAPTTVTTSSVNVGQSVTINSTSFVVSAKTLLATGVEYYTMKPATTRATPATFLRTNNLYKATAFTQAQYQSFLTTGKISSFGTIKEMLSNGRKLKYATKGSSMAVFVAKIGGGGVDIFEITGPGVVTLAADNGTGSGSGGCDKDLLGKDLCCAIDCICVGDGCGTYEKCVLTCRSSTSVGTTTMALHTILSSKPILFQ